MYSKVLVTYDGSELSKKSLEVAASYVQANPSMEVEVIYVSNLPYVVVADGVFIPTPSQTMDFLADSEAIVEDAKQRLSSLIPEARVVRKEGPIAKSILEYADETKCELIIIGSKGHSAIGEFVLGSVSHNVVQHSKVPVLIVK